MGVNKVDLSTGETLIDISNDTVTKETLAAGETAHGADGELIIGEMSTEVDTVDGWHFDVQPDSYTPPSDIKATLTFIYGG